MPSPAPLSDQEKPELLQQITHAADGGTVHLVRLVQRLDSYAFEPARIPIRSGDLVRFVMVGSQPESVAFDVAGVAPEVLEFVRREDLDRGVLLTDEGAAYDVSFREAPAGRYPFRSLPHGDRGMVGEVLVAE